MKQFDMLLSFFQSRAGVSSGAPRVRQRRHVDKSGDLKILVMKKYSNIAQAGIKRDESSCCGSGSSCCGGDPTAFSEDYSQLEGYNPDADLGLGCGIPTQFAGIHEGDTVIDLGSGAGNDVFVVRRLVGANGKVIGIDMTEAMIEKARENNRRLGYTNVEFRLGDIESIPVADNEADVVVSNCVMNLVPDKQKAFDETYRILKSGGHFSISDIVLQGVLPDNLRNEAELYAGCISGAVQKGDYLGIIRKAGFINLKVQKEREIEVPDEILKRHLTREQLRDFRENHFGIFSVTVFAEKPAF